MSQESLIAFTRYTKPDYQPAGHHKLIAEALERVERGECKRLMIFMPPRHGKSELASRRFPAWFLGRNPDRSIIAASYNSELATDFGREVRDVVGSKLYGNVFDTRLSENSQAAGRWHTNGRGGYVAAGVGTAVTGRGAHCFVAGTLVDTDVGPLPIEQLEHVSHTRKVLSYNHSTQQIELQNVQAFAARTGVGIYRVTTAAGRVVEATGDHPFFTERGYIEARSLAAGDRLLCVVSERSDQDRVCVSQMGNELRAGPLLLADVQPEARFDQRPQAVREVWRENASQDNAVLSRLSSQGGRTGKGVSEDTKDLPNLRQGVQRGVAREGEKVSGVLLQDLCGHRALQTHVWTGQSEVEGRRDAVAGESTRGAGVSGYAGTYSRARQLLLRSVQGNDQAGSASHRQLADEQQRYELDNPLLVASSTGTQLSGWKSERDYVLSVERIGEQARVFDIQVSENHNFFANGVLVHNCLLIDDPLKDRVEADSEVTREKVWRWYTSTAYTRLEGDVAASAIEDDDIWQDFQKEIAAGEAEPFEGAIVLIMTRWNEDDLAGRLIAAQKNGGDQWEVLDLPALSEDGKALWPEKYSAERLGRIRAAIGPRDWTALYQQRPAPEEGTYFQRAWFKRHARKPDVVNTYITSDYAVTEGGGDYTEHAVWGLDPDNRLFMLDWWHGQTSSDVWIERLLDLIDRWKPLCCFGEKGVIEKAVRPQLDRRMMERGIYARMEWLPSIADKPTRARSFQSRAAMGLVSLPETEDGERVLSQLLTFPAGKYDDAVDVCSLMGAAIDQAHSGIAMPANQRSAGLSGYGAPNDNRGTSWRT